MIHNSLSHGVNSITSTVCEHCHVRLCRRLGAIAKSARSGVYAARMRYEDIIKDHTSDVQALCSLVLSFMYGSSRCLYYENKESKDAFMRTHPSRNLRSLMSPVSSGKEGTLLMSKCFATSVRIFEISCRCALVKNVASPPGGHGSCWFDIRAARFGMAFGLGRSVDSTTHGPFLSSSRGS